MLSNIAAPPRRLAAAARFLTVLCLLALFCVTSGAAAEVGAEAPTIRVSNQAGRPMALVIDRQTIPLVANAGGFTLRDVTDGKEVRFNSGVVECLSAETHFRAESDGFLLNATFTPAQGHIRVHGKISSSRATDRAVILRYILPVPIKNAVFGEEISRSVRLMPDVKPLGTVYPIATMTGDTWGAALAIPPTFPCCFGMTVSGEGPVVEFYFGLSPQTRRFPNAASFTFLIYPVDPQWGFRSALAKYYALHPDHYTPRIKGGGMWNWQEKGEIEHALPLFRFQGITRTRTFLDEIERNRKFDLLTFDYIMVGQLELKHLSEAPEDYAAAVKIVDDFTKRWKADPDAMRKQYRHWRDRELPDFIERCACKKANGEYYLRIRQTVWAGNSITFPMNPNPWLFADKGLSSVGSTALQVTSEWFVKHCRLLHEAGWEPVTHARVGNDHIACERYGTGDIVYFALLNFAKEPQECEVVIDLTPLGFSPEQGQMFHISEIARDVEFTETSEASECRVRLTLNPDETCILKLERRW